MANQRPEREPRLEGEALRRRALEVDQPLVSDESVDDLAASVRGSGPESMEIGKGIPANDNDISITRGIMADKLRVVGAMSEEAERLYATSPEGVRGTINAAIEQHRSEDRGLVSELQNSLRRESKSDAEIRDAVGRLLESREYFRRNLIKSEDRITSGMELSPLELDRVMRFLKENSGKLKALSSDQNIDEEKRKGYARKILEIGSAKEFLDSKYRRFYIHARTEDADSHEITVSPSGSSGDEKEEIIREAAAAKLSGESVTVLIDGQTQNTTTAKTEELEAKRAELESKLKGPLTLLRHNQALAELTRVEKELRGFGGQAGQPLREAGVSDDIEQKLRAKTNELEKIEEEIRNWSSVTARLQNNAPERVALEKKKREVMAEMGDLRIARSGAVLEKNRSARIAAFDGYFKGKRNKNINPEELERLKEAAGASDEEHRRSLEAHVNMLLAKKMEELVGDPDGEEKFRRYKSEQLYEFLINEQVQLAEHQADVYPPKERGFLMKALGGYARMPRWARTLISASVAVAIAAGTGGISAGGMAGIFGMSVARSYIGAGASMGIRGLGEVIWQGTVGRRLGEAENELRERTGNLQPGKLDELFKDVAAAYERRATSEKRKRILLTTVQIAGSAAVGWGLHHAAERVLAGSAGPNAGGPRVLPTEKPGGAPPFTEQPSVGSNLENNIPSGGWPTGVDSHFFEAVDKIQSGDGIERVVTRHMELLAKVDPDTYDKISQSVAPGEHLDSGQIAHLLALRQHLENTGLAKPGGSIGVSAADGHITIHSETYAFPPDNAGSVVPLDHAPAAPDHGAVAPAPQAHDVAPNAAPTPPANNPFDYTHMKQPDLLRTLQAEEPALKNIPGGQGLDKRAQDMIGVLSHQASDPQIDSARKLMEDINNFFQSHGTHASTVSVTSEHIITSNIPGLETIDLDKANQSDLFRHLQTITEYLSKNPVGHGNVSQTLLDNARGIINVLSQPAGTRIDPAALDSARNLIVTLTGFLGKK